LWVIKVDLKSDIMIIQSAQSMSFSSDTAVEENVVLKTDSLYTGLRLTFTATQDHVLDHIDSIEIDCPDYGAQSSRIKLSGNEVYLLPLLCQLGNAGQADATAATSTSAVTGQDAATSFSHFDIPINKLSMDKDVRITIKAKGYISAGSGTLNVHFGFCDTPFRNVYFRTYNVPSAAGVYQNWFPSDGLLQGIVIGATDGSCTSGGVWNARSASNISEISLDGVRNTTFTRTQLLASGLDEVLSGGAQGSFIGSDIYAMVRNFIPEAGARYVSVDRAAACGLMIVGVMSDA